MKIKKFKEYNESIGEILSHAGNIVLGASAVLSLGVTLKNIFTRNKLYSLYDDYIKNNGEKVKVTDNNDRYFIQLGEDIHLRLFKNKPILITSVGTELKLKHNEHQNLLDIVSKQK